MRLVSLSVAGATTVVDVLCSILGGDTLVSSTHRYSRVYVCCCCCIVHMKQGIDADEWLNMGEKALTDDAARSQLLARMKVCVITTTATSLTASSTVSSTVSTSNVLLAAVAIVLCTAKDTSSCTVQTHIAVVVLMLFC
jgi:hypothetical protein